MVRYSVVRVPNAEGADAMHAETIPPSGQNEAQESSSPKLPGGPLMFRNRA